MPEGRWSAMLEPEHPPLLEGDEAPAHLPGGDLPGGHADVRQLISRPNDRADDRCRPRRARVAAIPRSDGERRVLPDHHLGGQQTVTRAQDDGDRRPIDRAEVVFSVERDVWASAVAATRSDEKPDQEQSAMAEGDRA